jgi:branched-chain amino acid transport system ATP-binding protein
MSEPKLLVIDEPSAGLSPVAVRELFETLQMVHGLGVSILLVEQNVTFSLKLADRVHIMQRGQIVYEGAVAELDPDKVATHLGIGRLLQRSLATVTKAKAAAVGSMTTTGGTG